MAFYSFIILAVIFASCGSIPVEKCSCTEYGFPFVSRSDWQARPSGPTSPLARPVPYVVIHHTYQPGVCLTLESCKASMRSMQLFHQVDNGWADIGYNFAIGGEGRVYEGRGWDVVGAHAVGYNVMSIGIALIGDWVSNVPPQVSLEAVHALINTGVRLGFIAPDYLLIGHRQASATECPGDALFREISTWEHFKRT